MHHVAWVGLFTLIMIAGVASADWLPNQTYENQRISITTIIDVIGMVEDSTQFSWVIASPGSIPAGMLGAQQSVADLSYHDSIMTNGGHLMMNKNVVFDSQDMSNGMYNLETQKVLTYNSVDGSHMVGEEELTLSVAGSYRTADDTMRCVFSQGSGHDLPSFCDIVTAKSSLINVNSAQISSKGQVRGVSANSDVPAELNYQIAVTPDAGSGNEYAQGTVKTQFAGSIMEARDGTTDNWNKTSATRDWKDSADVTGGIRNFQQALHYRSGLRI